VQLGALAVGATFLLVGILAFVPGITAHYDMLTMAGPGSGAHLLGVFAVSVLHNIVHLAFGATGLVLSGTFHGARWFLIGGGVIYLVLWLDGLVVNLQEPVNFVPLEMADNWLHLALAVGMLGLGFVLGRRPAHAVRADGLTDPGAGIETGSLRFRVDLAGGFG
jgi:hypothetical protein